MILVDDNDYNKNPLNTPPTFREIEDAGMCQKIADIRIWVKLKNGQDISLSIGEDAIKRDLGMLSDVGLIDFIKSYTDLLSEMMAVELAKEFDPKS